LYMLIESGETFFAYFSPADDEYSHEYNFTIDPTLFDIHSTGDWNELVSLCFNSQSSWDAIYLPTTILTSKPEGHSTYSRSANSIESQMIDWLEEDIGSAAYSRKIIDTRQWNGVLFHCHEDLVLTAEEVHYFHFSTAVSVASAINTIKNIIDAITISIDDLLDLLDIVGGIVPSGTEVETYLIGARWDRYVKRRDSSIWLTAATQRYVSYDAFVTPAGSWFVDELTREEEYAPSRAYFEDTGTQIQEGYYYYLANP